MKRIICILMAAMPLLAMAQGRTSVKLDEAGQLASKIFEASWPAASNLTLVRP